MKTKDLKQSDVGRWVEFTHYHGKKERGKIKSWGENFIFVVFHCDGQWDRFQSFTGQACDPDHLQFIERIEVTNSMVGLFGMQVCAVPDATDEEILSFCNYKNPAGTSNGWSHVLRNESDVRKYSFFDKHEPKKFMPVNCEEHPQMLHFLILC